MKLQDFVTETLVEIVTGVREAQKAVDSLGGQINPYRGSAEATRDIEFDVEVSAEAGTGTKGKLGVFVGPIAAGTQGQSDSKSSSVGRVRFKIAASLPTHPRKPENKT